jgi:hypothetical protein
VGHRCTRGQLSEPLEGRVIACDVERHDRDVGGLESGDDLDAWSTVAAPV